MIKKILIFVLLVSQCSFAQKAQKVGYIDREYILENVPEYKTAQSKLDAKINKWNVSLNKLKSEIDNLKLTLVNEKALLTPDIIAEREEDITIKETAFKEKKEAYFGTSGDLFMLRKQLVKPVQDQIFNAIQEIAKTKKYDIILDKAGNDLVMLYTNPKYDISELVLQKIVKGRKKKATEKKKTDQQLAREQKKKELKAKAEDRRTKQEKLRDRIKKQNEAKAAKREAVKKANAEKRAKRIADAKARREALKNKGKKKPVKKDDTTKGKPIIDDKEVNKEVKNRTEEPIKKTKEELRAEKEQKLKDRAAAKKARRDSLRNVSNEKRAKKLKEIEERKKKLQESKNPKKPNITDTTNKKDNLAKDTPVSDKKEVENKTEFDEKTVDNSVKKTKEELRTEKIQNLKDRTAAKRKRRDSLRNVANEKRAKKLKEIEERKKKLQESKNKNN